MYLWFYFYVYMSSMLTFFFFLEIAKLCLRLSRYTKEQEHCKLQIRHVKHTDELIFWCIPVPYSIHSSSKPNFQKQNQDIIAMSVSTLKLWIWQNILVSGYSLLHGEWFSFSMILFNVILFRFVTAMVLPVFLSQILCLLSVRVVAFCFDCISLCSYGISETRTNFQPNNTQIAILVGLVLPLSTIFLSRHQIQFHKADS